MSNDRSLATSRHLPFSPAQIYGAFASPELLARWWGPAGFRNTFERFEFAVGGRWNFVMHGPDGQRYHNQNVFEALEPNARVVIRHANAPLFTLTVQLLPDGDGTLLRWDQVFDEAATARAVERIVRPANEQNLDRLTEALNSCIDSSLQGGGTNADQHPRG